MLPQHIKNQSNVLPRDYQNTVCKLTLAFPPNHRTNSTGNPSLCSASCYCFGGRRLGSGQFGDVYKALVFGLRTMDQPQQVAVKVSFVLLLNIDCSGLWYGNLRVETGAYIMSSLILMRAGAKFQR